MCLCGHACPGKEGAEGRSERAVRKEGSPARYRWRPGADAESSEQPGAQACSIKNSHLSAPGGVRGVYARSPSPLEGEV